MLFDPEHHQMIPLIVGGGDVRGQGQEFGDGKDRGPITDMPLTQGINNATTRANPALQSDGVRRYLGSLTKIEEETAKFR